MATRLKQLLLFLSALVAINICFFVVHYERDRVPTALVKQKVLQGYRHSSVSEWDYPLQKYGLSSPLTTIGLDHWDDCFIYLMALYRDEDAVKNAVAAGRYSIQREHSPCQALKTIITNRYQESELVVSTKPRLWHGAKPVLLYLLPHLDIFQISELIKLLTYFSWGLVLFLIALYHKQSAISFLPVFAVGVMASGITYYGGVSNALPYLVALLNAAALILIGQNTKRLFYLCVCTALMGSVSAFVYIVEGSVVLFLCIAAFYTYFVRGDGQSAAQRLYITVAVCATFMAGFAFSLLFKQLVSAWFLGAGVWEAFFHQVIHRMTGSVGGKEISGFDAITKQIGYYRYAFLNWHAGAGMLWSAGLLSWALAAVIGLYAVIKQRSHALELLVFGGIGSAILLRYALMANHSFIHVIMVGRYLFLVIGFGLAALVWFALSLRGRPVESTASQR